MTVIPRLLSHLSSVTGETCQSASRACPDDSVEVYRKGCKRSIGQATPFRRIVPEAAAIEEAKASIELEMYIFAADQTGLDVLPARRTVEILVFKVN